jgi:glucosamine 6-phosphate synthetase-like amidotransferase/phosphosugar isomerase protein
MIHEIPASIEATLARNARVAEELAHRLEDHTRFVFTGSGTAFYDAVLAAQFLSSVGHFDVRPRSIEAFELAHYDGFVDASTVVTAISHSGITKTTLDGLRAARAKGALCIGVTHFPDRPIAQVVDQVILAGNSPDLSRCHTKCYVAAAAACAQLGIAVAKARPASRDLQALKDGLHGLPRLTKAVLAATDRAAAQLAEKHRGATCYYVAGAGSNVATALEASLKLLETSFVPALGMETEQMLHGPWVSWNQGTLVVVIAPRGAADGRSLDLARAAKAVGAPVVAVVTEGDTAFAPVCDDIMPLPSLDERLSPFTCILPLYFFAYYASVQRGINPDYLRYLTPAYWSARGFIFPPGTH